MSWLWW